MKYEGTLYGKIGRRKYFPLTPWTSEDIDRLCQIEELYDQLIFAVGNKYPDESRHQTALRYIKNAESNQNTEEQIPYETK